METGEPLLLPNQGFKLTDTFFLLFCEKNSDGTKHLRLKGKDMYQRIGKRINHMDVLALCGFLRNNLDIVSVDLCYNELGDPGVSLLAEYYFNDENPLLHLNLMSNDITFVGISKLYSVAENLKLKTLRIGGNKFGRKGGEYIAKMIECIPTLELLEIGDTDQILTSIDAVLEMAKNSNLKLLDISRIIPKSPYFVFNPSWAAKNTGLFLEVNTSLTELHMEKCELDGHDIEKMMLGLKYNKTLKLLNLAANKISCFGLKVIAQWLKNQSPLIGLDVSNNRIGNTGARALSMGMCYSKLLFLNISNNRIEDNGLASILDTLKKPYQMRLFFFYGNPFASKTLKIIKRMILSGVLLEDYIDIKLYEVDEELKAAYNPVNHFKQQYYSVMSYGCPVFLKIKRNEMEKPDHKRRPFYHLPWYERYQLLKY